MGEKGQSRETLNMIYIRFRYQHSKLEEIMNEEPKLA